MRRLLLECLAFSPAKGLAFGRILSCEHVIVQMTQHAQNDQPAEFGLAPACAAEAGPKSSNQFKNSVHSGEIQIELEEI